jgi:hypothetical protein
MVDRVNGIYADVMLGEEKINQIYHVLVPVRSAWLLVVYNDYLEVLAQVSHARD